jgi:hypothetical protein
MVTSSAPWATGAADAGTATREKTNTTANNRFNECAKRRLDWDIADLLK